MASVSDYYHQIESRVGYQLVLGGTRHFGYYKVGTWWPFPIGAALRRLEEKVYQALGQISDALVLDGGAGTCEVAIYMAKRGLRVKAVDLLDLHVGQAKRNVQKNGQAGRIELHQMNYQELAFDDETFNGAYTLETLVHADNPDQAMREFFRVLKPGGVLVHVEYEHNVTENSPASRKLARVNKSCHMPAFDQFTYGTIQKKLEKIGFRVEVQDLSHNALPMLRFFFILALLPYILIRLFRLEAKFPNAVAAVDLYRISSDIRFIMVKAKKPEKAVNRSYVNGEDSAISGFVRDDEMRRRF